MHTKYADLARTASCWHEQPDDDLNPCRGLLWATVISAPLWGVLMWVVL